MPFRLCLILARSTSPLVLSYALCLELVRLGAYFREQQKSSRLGNERIDPLVERRAGSRHNAARLHLRERGRFRRLDFITSERPYEHCSVPGVAFNDKLVRL